MVDRRLEAEELYRARVSSPMIAFGGGSSMDVAKLVAEYRKKVNPNVQVYLVQVAGYQDTLIPEVYPRTHILGGWGDGILRYAARMAAMENGASQ